MSIWKAKITNKETFIQAVAAGEAPMEALEIRLPFLNGVAREKKIEGQIFPGVVGYTEGRTNFR